jgi:uncharacterized repeat protein (TIGR02543 family)
MKKSIYLTAAVCLLCLSQAQAQNFNINAGSVTIEAAGTYRISGNGSATSNTIKVDSGVVADITLENVNIDVSGITNACAFDMSGATVTLRLFGENTLKSGHTTSASASCAGLQAPEGSTLTITSIDGDGSANGTLNVTGGTYGAAIGGCQGRSGGAIAILGGTVNATAGYAAGIGGGHGGSGGHITISGGDVNATSVGTRGAGIGGGGGGLFDSGSGIITISGGIVNATGGLMAAGIGGGDRLHISDIGIGGGDKGNDGSISISGGTVIAGGRGIGIGGGKTPTTITGTPVIFATAINGISSNPGNGIATEGDVNIDPSTKTITLNTDFTVPAGITLTVPDGWTLDHRIYSLTTDGSTNGNIISERNNKSFNINAGSVTITADGIYTITGNGTATANTIKVNPGVLARITLENVNIGSGGCAFDMSGATVVLRLSGTNTLQSGDRCAGLFVPADAKLTITSISGDGSTDGTLNATGSGFGGAGIGGGSLNGSGAITISGGTVNATSGGGAAGIGGGLLKGSGAITISGGIVNATGGLNGAGIGGGNIGDCEIINISGGTVTATGGERSPGIGGGAGCNGCGGSGGGIIAISGGTVIATGGDKGIGNGSISITGNPIIFATAINGTPSNPRNGIATGSDVNINPSNKTITLNRDFTIPQNALLALPARWTLNYQGHLLTNNGTMIPARQICTVSFDVNGHGAAIDPVTHVVEGSQLATVKPANPAAEGYIFGGWYKEVGCTNPWNFSSDKITGNTTLYAKWIVIPADLTAYNINAGNVTITTNGYYRIYGTGARTRNTITVNPGVVAAIRLENVNIDVNFFERCAFDMSGATVVLCLSGVNTLQSDENYAGLQAPAGATLIITSISGDGSANGTLNATGGNRGAGIGGGYNGSGGAITISGGTVNATGGSKNIISTMGGAGIGKGGADSYNKGRSGGTIIISGGRVTATGGTGGAGIGGNIVAIYGGTVTATSSGGDNAGIGSGATSSGNNGSSGTVTITGGTVYATGSSGGAGIGGSYRNSGGIITITGGTVTAIGGYLGASIGGGNGGNGGTITIIGGTVHATGGFGGAGIGGGNNGGGGSITISGGTVIAGSDAYGAGIGGGYNGSSGDITISGGTVIADGMVIAYDAYGASIGGGYKGGVTGSISIGAGTIIATGSGIGIVAAGESTPTTITGNPVIFATAINGISSAPERGIATGRDVNIDLLSKTIILYTNLTVPTGVRIALPNDWTLNKNGYSVTSNGAALSGWVKRIITD